MAPVRNIYIMYIIHIIVFEDLFSRNGNVGPGTYLQSDDGAWPTGI